MKYSLRSLITAATLGPPLLAGAYLACGFALKAAGILTPSGWAVVASLGVAVMVPLTLCSWALVRLGHREQPQLDTLLTGRASLPLAMFTLLVVVAIPAVVIALLTLPLWWAS